MWWVWFGFLLFVFICLGIDLFVFNKEDHTISVKEAGKQTSVWVLTALFFSVVVWWLFREGWVENPTNLMPRDAFLDYLTGYLVELSLSVDNLFVIAVIFTSFKIPEKYRHRVLFWGILGAMFFRALMIFFGVSLIHKFDWIIYVFGAFLLYTAYGMLRHNDQMDPKNSWVYKQLKKFLPITDEIRGHDFFIHKAEKRYATPLFVALVVIEVTDVMFAFDSIPAILAITQDEFIAFSSNIMAILGLRSMFFLMVGVLEKFKYINYSLAFILGFVGLKMLFDHYIEIPSWASLLVILLGLGGGIVASLALQPEEKKGE